RRSTDLRPARRVTTQARQSLGQGAATPTLTAGSVLVPFPSKRSRTRRLDQASGGVVPGRGLLLGSVSHPWLTRRRSASMRCSPQPPPRNAHRPVIDLASDRAVTKHRTWSGGEPRPDDRGSRKAKHGCFARESGQDALTERRAIPGRQGAASVRSHDWQALPLACSLTSTGRRAHLLASNAFRP